MEDEEMIDKALESMPPVNLENIEEDVQATAYDYTDYRYFEQIISKQDTIIDNQQTTIYNQEQTMIKLDDLIKVSECSCFLVCVIFIFIFIKSIFHI